MIPVYKDIYKDSVQSISNAKMKLPYSRHKVGCSPFWIQFLQKGWHFCRSRIQRKKGPVGCVVPWPKKGKNTRATNDVFFLGQILAIKSFKFWGYPTRFRVRSAFLFPYKPLKNGCWTIVFLQCVMILFPRSTVY